MRKKHTVKDFVKHAVYKSKENPSNGQYADALFLLLCLGATNQEEVIKFIKEWERDAEDSGKEKRL